MTQFLTHYTFEIDFGKQAKFVILRIFKKFVIFFTRQKCVISNSAQQCFVILQILKYICLSKYLASKNKLVLDKSLGIMSLLSAFTVFL